MTGHAIHIKLDGRTYSGTYKVDRQVLTVTTNYGRKAGPVVPRKPGGACSRTSPGACTGGEGTQRLNALIRNTPCARSARSGSKFSATKITTHCASSVVLATAAPDA